MEFQIHIPFVQMLGMTLERFEPGVAEIHQPLRDELTNSWGVAHGGVTMTLLDVVMAHAARTPTVADGEPQPGIVTIEMKTSFLRPGTGVLKGTARRLHHTRSMAFCDGEVRDEQGQLVATASGTFKYVRALTVGDQQVQRRGASD